MKKRLVSSSLLAFALTLNACGQGSASSSSELQSAVPHKLCADAAYSKRASSYDKAAKNFEADAAACYELLDAGHYVSVSLCLKAAESARKQTLSDADLALSLDLATCEEAL